MPIAKRGSRARLSPWVRCKAGALVNTSSIRSEVTGTIMRAVIAKLSGCRRRAVLQWKGRLENRGAPENRGQSWPPCLTSRQRQKFATGPKNFRHLPQTGDVVLLDILYL